MGDLILHACPVCGSTDQRMYEEGMARRDENDMWFTDEVSTTIECNVCGHNVSDWNEVDVLEKWNNTPPSKWELNWWRKHNCDT